MDVIVALAGLAVAIALYFLPGIIAANRGHPNGGSIFLLNLLLGWTFLGWVVALVWSVSSIAPPVTPVQPTSAGPTAGSVGRRPCPACAELILPEARKCRFCGTELAEGWAAGLAASAQEGSAPSAPGPELHELPPRFSYESEDEYVARMRGRGYEPLPPDAGLTPDQRNAIEAARRRGS